MIRRSVRGEVFEPRFRLLERRPVPGRHGRGVDVRRCNDRRQPQALGRTPMDIAYTDEQEALRRELRAYY